MANAEATAAPNGNAANQNGSDPVPSEQHATLAEALLAAQVDMPPVERDQVNPHFKNKFTSLGRLLATVKPILNRNGIVLVQAPSTDDEGKFVLRTILLHAPSEERLEFDAPLSPEKNTPQGQGSAITYMRRYSAAAALAIADQEDDDGNAGSGQADGRPRDNRGGGTAQAKRRQGQGDGKSPVATSDQRKELIALARGLGLADAQTQAWLEWNAHTGMTDRIPRVRVGELIALLKDYEDAAEALANFNGALEAEDERAQRIASKYSGGGEGR